MDRIFHTIDPIYVLLDFSCSQLSSRHRFVPKAQQVFHWQQRIILSMHGSVSFFWVDQASVLMQALVR